MLRALFFLVVLSLPLFLTKSVEANGYANGTVLDGYTYRDGYWWNSGVAYNRVAVSVCRNGYCRYEWQYQPVTNYSAQGISSSDPSWRAKLLELASLRDRYELSTKKSNEEHKQYLEAIEALGLTGNFRIEGYGQYTSPMVQGYGQYPYNYATVQSTQTVAPQGQTVYGYTQQTLSNVYSPYDLTIPLNQAARLTENAQTLAGQANSDYQNNVAMLGNNLARVAEIHAKGAAAAASLSAANAPPSSTTETKTFSFGSGMGINQPKPIDPVNEVKSEEYREAFKKHLANNCLMCHNKENPTSSVDLTDWDNFTRKEQDWVIKSVESGNMPRKFGAPQERAKPLTKDAIQLYYLNRKAS